MSASKSPAVQQLIDFKPAAENVFATFVAKHNEQAFAYLQSLDARNTDTLHQACLCGSSASGKTHLLQAVCHAAQQRSESSIYLPMRSLIADYDSSLLDGLEMIDVVCIDDIDVIAGQKVWEEVLFNLINHMRARLGACLITSALSSPRNIHFLLPDLSSRLMWGGVYDLNGLPDADKIEAIRLRMRFLGNEIDDKVVTWLLNHCSRDMADIMQALNELNRVSLLERRKITVQFANALLRP